MYFLICWPGWCIFRARLRLNFNRTPWLIPGSQTRNVRGCRALTAHKALYSIPLCPRFAGERTRKTLTRSRLLWHSHARVFAQYTRVTQIAHSDHTLNPKGKWHNRDTKASHLHLRRTASYRLRWGSNTCSARGKCGSLFHKWTSHPLYMKIRLAADFTRLETGGKQTRKTKIITLLCCILDFYCCFG